MSEQILYRGIHGESGDFLETRHATLTFTDNPDVAWRYAQRPNNNKDIPEKPQVGHFLVDINNPAINFPNDPFVDIAHIIEKLGPAAGFKAAIKFEEAIYNTDNWGELSKESNIHSIKEMIATKPFLIKELYFDSFHICDDLEFTQMFKKKGYDGYITAGTGEGAQTTEYRPFSIDQITRLPEPQKSKTFTSLDI